MNRRILGVRLAVLGSAFLLSGLSIGASPAAAGASLRVPGSQSGCGCEPSFTIEKRQEIAGSNAGFTTSPLSGTIGDTVDYEIVVTNTGGEALAFSDFSDPHCDPGTLAGGPGTGLVGTNQSTTFTCSRALTGAGVYTNEATITGTTPFENSLTQTSNQVVVEVPAPPPTPEPAFTIEKLQEIVGSASGFTTSRLTATTGQTVAYQIVVTNTGNVPETFGELSDGHCDANTIGGGPGALPLGPGASAAYTCSHILTSEGTWVNQATVTATPVGGSPLTHTSNQVEVGVTAPASPTPSQGQSPAAAPVVPPAPVVAAGEVKCSRESNAVLRGASGPKRSPFTVRATAAGVKQIIFYLDGRKLKAMSQSQAKRGSFALRIDPRKLSHGVHTLSIKALSTVKECPPVATASRFVHPAARIHVSPTG